MSVVKENNYRRIRLLIGSLGMLLPIVLPFFQFILTIFQDDTAAVFLPSISHYNYSYASVVFTGVLMSFGLLLISYKGYLKDAQLIKDDLIASVAGTLAIVVSLVPTQYDDDSLLTTPNCHENPKIAAIHLTCAGGFLILLGLMSIFKFTKSDKTDVFHMRRKKAYRICGWIVISSIAILAALFLISHFSKNEFDMGHTVFIFEMTSLFAFGFAWLLKGKASFFVPLKLITQKELEEVRRDADEENL